MAIATVDEELADLKKQQAIERRRTIDTWRYHAGNVWGNYLEWIFPEGGGIGRAVGLGSLTGLDVLWDLTKASAKFATSPVYLPYVAIKYTRSEAAKKHGSDDALAATLNRHADRAANKTVPSKSGTRDIPRQRVNEAARYGANVVAHAQWLTKEGAVWDNANRSNLIGAMNKRWGTNMESVLGGLDPFDAAVIPVGGAPGKGVPLTEQQWCQVLLAFDMVDNLDFTTEGGRDVLRTALNSPWGLKTNGSKGAFARGWWMATQSGVGATRAGRVGYLSTSPLLADSDEATELAKFGAAEVMEARERFDRQVDRNLRDPAHVNVTREGTNLEPTLGVTLDMAF